jgi:hypothetical protein
MSTANRHLEKLMSELGIRPRTDGAEKDRSEPADEKQEEVPSEQPQQDEVERYTSPWAA